MEYSQEYIQTEVEVVEEVEEVEEVAEVVEEVVEAKMDIQDTH
jgi:hypothetical protein